MAWDIFRPRFIVTGVTGQDKDRSGAPFRTVSHSNWHSGFFGEAKDRSVEKNGDKGKRLRCKPEARIVFNQCVLKQDLARRAVGKRYEPGRANGSRCTAATRYMVRLVFHYAGCHGPWPMSSGARG